MDVMRTNEELIQLYKEGLIGPNVIRNREIIDKVNGMPGKLSGRVRHVAALMGLNIRTIYRILKI